MGAMTFITSGFGDSVAAAFTDARDRALYDHGHSGYSGTLAEKNEYVVINLPPKEEPYDFSEKLINDADPRIDDKWGPAGAIKFPDEEERWLFFGWASS